MPFALTLTSQQVRRETKGKGQKEGKVVDQQERVDRNHPHRHDHRCSDDHSGTQMINKQL